MARVEEAHKLVGITNSVINEFSGEINLDELADKILINPSVTKNNSE